MSHLRQIGLGLLVARDSRLPFYYRIYPGNVHDSKHFEAIMDQMFGIVCGLHNTKERLTVVIDKGMNSEDNYAWIDEHSRFHFVTTYSTYFAQDLATIPIERFEPLDIPKNLRLVEEGMPEERLLAYRTSGEYWGKKRTVVVTYNPSTARKKNYTLQSKLETLCEELLLIRAKVKERARVLVQREMEFRDSQISYLWPGRSAVSEWPYESQLLPAVCLCRHGRQALRFARLAACVESLTMQFNLCFKDFYFVFS
ncbi:MAG: transposase [Deltaproteobacteria bacterium]|nr:transposase [Deltaproteobacteria bacterium]